MIHAPIITIAQVKALNKRYIGPAPSGITARELRELAVSYKDSGYHRELLQAANTIEQLKEQEATK